MKIIDWNAAGLALTQLVIGPLFVLFANGSVRGLVIVLGIVISVIGFVGCRQALNGVVFDDQHVSFYSFMFPRRLALCEIRAANCEFGLRFSPFLLFAIAGGGTKSRGRRSGSTQLRSYMVNLSGEFGTAQVRFYNKRWRDAFLMALRDRSPRCRITRWN